MSIRYEEERLFSVWSNGRSGFVTDGVADERLYRESETKLLFVLKEVNDLGGGGWDLREFVRKNGGQVLFHVSSSKCMKQGPTVRSNSNQSSGLESRPGNCPYAPVA